MADFKETSSRHLRFKLQSLGRRLDELEEATKNLQKAEDEVLDLQDKIIQAEGSNSSMLADVESLRKRVLKIEGKDEEIKKAEDLCRLMKEKLEEEECATVMLKSQIENLQKRMTELEKLEEAFSKSKNECTQLCLSLNEEKNVSRKLSADLEFLRVKVKEMEASEIKIDKTEQHFVSELEKIKSLTLMFVNERKKFLEKERQNEKVIDELKQTLEQNNKINLSNQSRNTSDLLEKSTKCYLERSDLRIEDDISSKLPAKVNKRKSSLDYVKLISDNETISVPENEKNKNHEDNKVKELNQEIEKLRTQLNHLKSVEEELKQMNAKNNTLHDRYLSEQSKNKVLTEQLEKMKIEAQKLKDMENGTSENEEISSAGRIHDRSKYRSDFSAKYKTREHSPPLRRERMPSRDISQNYEGVAHSSRLASNASAPSRRPATTLHFSGPIDAAMEDLSKAENKTATSSYLSTVKDASSLQSDLKKSKEQPSVLSRYPPAAQEHNPSKSWKVSSKPESGPKNRTQKTSRTFGDVYSANPQNPSQRKAETAVLSCDKAHRKNQGNDADVPTVMVSGHSNTLVNGTVVPLMTYTQSRKSVTDTSTTLCAEATASTASAIESLQSRPCEMLDSAELEPVDPTVQSTTPRSTSRYLHHSRSQDSTPSNLDKEEELTNSRLQSRKLFSSRELVAPKVTANTNGRFNSEHAVENLADAAQENTTASVQPDVEIKNAFVSGEILKPRIPARSSYLENDKKENEEEESKQSSRAHSNYIGSSDDVGQSSIHSRRSFSPREALRSKAIIKPAIVEKDLKEIMGGSGTESYAERRKSPKPMASKMTSSITIYPSEPVTTRGSTSGTTKERLTSTSNIVITPTPNDLLLVSNSFGTSFDISIKKSDIAMTSPETVKPQNNVVLQNDPDQIISRNFRTLSSQDSAEINNDECALETISWKSHSAVDVEASVEAKKGFGRVRHSLSPLEELDAKTGRNKDFNDISSRLETLIDAETKRSHNQYLRRTSAMINSWNTPPDLGSRRSKSSLSASELVTKRSYGPDSSLTSGFAPWNRPSLQEDSSDVVTRPRRKQAGSADRISRTDLCSKRQSAKVELQQDHNLQGNKIEERIRHRRYYSDDK
ncbi:leucine zipper protein 1 [Ambystoma mexicanum]|uniref:leucine zipper protein 1 n=1 Tax=Ambystoma mexicanum TaxID=8296 RepID=UPI0037E86E80